MKKNFLNEIIKEGYPKQLIKHYMVLLFSRLLLIHSNVF